MAKVDYRHNQYNKYQDSWAKCLDAYEGQDAIKRGREIYLPRLSGQVINMDSISASDRDKGHGMLQTESEYDTYLHRAIYYNYIKKVTDGLNEQLFRKNVKIEIPVQMQEIIDKFTYNGKSLRTAIKESNRDIFLNYRSVLVLDVPETNVEIKTVADRERMNIRPYGVFYRASDVINWRYKNVNNMQELSLVVISEMVEEFDDDEFEPQTVEQYRVLDLDEENTYRVRLFRRENKDGDFEPYGEDIYPMINGNKLDSIPCFFLTKKGISPDLDYPIMNDSADINIAHYINSADYENALNITGSPTAVIKGLEVDPDDTDREVSLGPNRAFLLETDGDAYFMEYQGQGLDGISNAMTKKVDALSVIAGRILQNDPKGVESAETAQIHRSAEHGQLSSMALSLAESYEHILTLIASWIGISGKIEVSFNTDYTIHNIDPQLLSNLNTAKQSGAISFRTYFYNLIKGEMIPDDWTEEDEREAIAQDMVDIGNLNIGFEEESLEEEAEED